MLLELMGLVCVAAFVVADVGSDSAAEDEAREAERRRAGMDAWAAEQAARLAEIKANARQWEADRAAREASARAAEASAARVAAVADAWKPGRGRP